MPIAFDNSYARLPDRFFASARPHVSPNPSLIAVNDGLAETLGIDSAWLRGADGLAMLSGRVVPEDAMPIAQAYAGHQFGQFVPQLGDGRAILLGEVIDCAGARRDIQLKGAGRTAYSRGGDGRAALGPVLREYVVSEAMAALGIPTTRALAAVLTGDTVSRDTMLPGAMLTRVAASHIRVGTFQYFAAHGDHDALRLLADHVIARHHPHAGGGDQPYHALLDAVIAAQASLVARWLLVGFIHGVMNTDNMTIAGETIDYGPCAFMDAYDPAMVFSSIDRAGRYAYANQPRIAQWNLARLAEAMLPLLGDSEECAIAAAETALGAFPALFEARFRAGLCAKLGLATQEPEDAALGGDLLARMHANAVDFTLLFRRLGDAVCGDDAPARALFADPDAFDAWAVGWRARMARDGRTADQRRRAMDAVNPAFIPRNHQIERLIRAANTGDFEPFHTMLRVLSRPYDTQPDAIAYGEPPRPEERVTATFCGT